MSRRLIATAVAVLACAMPLVASAALSKVGGTVEIDAKVPLFNFTATSDELKVSDDGKELKFSLPVKSIKTGIGPRDKDMIKRFSNGDVVLTVARDKVNFPTDKPTKGTVPGKVSLNGVTSDVAVHYTAKKEGGVIKVDANFSFNYKPHHQEPDGPKGGDKGACNLGVCVKSPLEVRLKDGQFKE